MARGTSRRADPQVSAVLRSIEKKIRHGGPVWVYFLDDNSGVSHYYLGNGSCLISLDSLKSKCAPSPSLSGDTRLQRPRAGPVATIHAIMCQDLSACVLVERLGARRS